eukprot:scaffold6392_cov71-Attheya_sp.AAC.1
MGRRYYGTQYKASKMNKEYIPEGHGFESSKGLAFCIKTLALFSVQCIRDSSSRWDNNQVREN